MYLLLSARSFALPLVGQQAQQLAQRRLVPGFDLQPALDVTAGVSVFAAPLVIIGQLLQGCKRCPLPVFPLGQHPFVKNGAVFQEKAIEERPRYRAVPAAKRAMQSGQRPFRWP
jgi:hypothetical protein